MPRVFVVALRILLVASLVIVPKFVFSRSNHTKAKNPQAEICDLFVADNKPVTAAHFNIVAHDVMICGLQIALPDGMKAFPAEPGTAALTPRRGRVRRELL